MATAFLERQICRPILESSKKGSDAFRNEYRKEIPTQAIIDDVVSYLGEYRFNLPKYTYNFKFRSGQLMDPNRNESMLEVAQRAIDLKNREGRSSIREQAEKIGFQSLTRQLIDSKTGDTIIWASPPGPTSEGYGDYGFVYFGKVEKNILERNIKMTAIRVENPTTEQFREVVHMLTGDKVEWNCAEDFLKNLKVLVENVKEGYVDAILKRVFNFKPNEEEQEEFRKIINKMFPLIYDFATNPLRTREDLYALENYALELKRECYVYEREAPSRLRDLGVIYRNEPPKAAGSCGSTSSNNVFNSTSLLNDLLSEDKYGSRSFKCPSCGKTNIRPKDELISNCQHCGKDVTC